MSIFLNEKKEPTFNGRNNLLEWVDRIWILIDRLVKKNIFENNQYMNVH